MKVYLKFNGRYSIDNKIVSAREFYQSLHNDVRVYPIASVAWRPVVKRKQVEVILHLTSVETVL